MGELVFQTLEWWFIEDIVLLKRMELRMYYS